MLWLWEAEGNFNAENFGIVIDEKGKRVGRVLIRALSRGREAQGERL